MLPSFRCRIVTASATVNGTTWWITASARIAYSLVSFGGGPSCGRRAGANCACAPSHTHAGSDSVAAVAISPRSADPGNFVGRTLEENVAALPCVNGRKNSKKLFAVPALSVPRAKEFADNQPFQPSRAGRNHRALVLVAVPPAQGLVSRPLRDFLTLAKKLRQLAIHLLGVRQLMQCGPSFTTARRADLIIWRCALPKLLGDIRSASP